MLIAGQSTRTPDVQRVYGDAKIAKWVFGDALNEARDGDRDLRVVGHERRGAIGPRRTNQWTDSNRAVRFHKAFMGRFPLAPKG